MSTTTVSFTTYDELQSYFADLSILPRLSAQQEETLPCRLRLAQQGLLSPEQARSAKHRLIKGCLYRVIRLAKEQQPLFHRFSLADLIQEGNLGLLQAVEDFDFTDPQGNFFAYATACIRNAITRALPRDGLLSIHRLQFWQLAQQGKLKEWDRSQPLSLDRPDEEGRSYYGVLPACSALTPVVSDTARLHVEELLARLSAREQTVLRLCYGVDEADGRPVTFCMSCVAPPGRHAPGTRRCHRQPEQLYHAHPKRASRRSKGGDFHLFPSAKEERLMKKPFYVRTEHVPV